MEKKQSSVEWLEKEFYTYARSTGIDNDKWVIKEETLDKLFEQAKAMHKEQYIDAWMNGQNDSGYSQKELRQMAEEDYNQTYGQ